MNWKELLDDIVDLQKMYPEHLADLYIEDDTQYINKYMVWFDKSKYIDNYKIWDIVKTWVMVDIKEEYNHNSRVIIYLQEKESNWELSKIFLTKIHKKIDISENWFAIDFINLFLLN